MKYDDVNDSSAEDAVDIVELSDALPSVVVASVKSNDYQRVVVSNFKAASIGFQADSDLANRIPRAYQWLGSSARMIANFLITQSTCNVLIVVNVSRSGYPSR